MNHHKKIIFILNPISGVGKKGLVEKYVSRYIDRQKFEFEFLYSQYAGHSTVLASESLSKGVDIIVAVGGDGTVNEVAKVLAGTDTIMAVIPTGSGNGLARHLKIPIQIKSAIQLINQGKIKRIDSAKIDDVFFLSVAGVGFDAKVANDFAAIPQRGFFSYLKLTFSGYFSYKRKTYRLLYDEGELNEKAFFITFANSNQFGYNCKVSPKASLTDGCIDICIMQKIPWYSILYLTLLVILGKTHHFKQLKIIKSTFVEIQCNTDDFLHIDGDPLKKTRQFKVEVIPASIKIIIP